jgi:hypothetical protein
MCTSKPKAPKPPPPPAAAPTYVDADVQGAYSNEKRRQRGMSGRQSTILTSSSGLSGSGNTGKTLLGGGGG